MFSLFSCLLTSPPLLAPPIPPPPPSLPPKHKEHTYEGVFFVFEKFSTHQRHPPPTIHTKHAHMGMFRVYVCSSAIPNLQTRKMCHFSRVFRVQPLSYASTHTKHTLYGMFCVCGYSFAIPVLRTQKLRLKWPVFRVWQLHLGITRGFKNPRDYG